MTSPATALYPPYSDLVPTGGVSAVAFFGPVIGGSITNPSSPDDQNVPIAELLYVSLNGPAGTAAEGTTFALAPGQTFNFPSGLENDVWVNAWTSGHRFAGFAINPAIPPEPTPTPGPFPPSGPTTVLKTLISYLYQEYNEDDDLQAFVDAYNELTKGFVDWFVDVPLPVYTNVNVSGLLLDWVGEGLYGMFRPTLQSGKVLSIGPFNTYQFNDPAATFNVNKTLGDSNFYQTSDDYYRRILTWHFFKGDGKVFTIPWLKRRVERFLNGVDGVDPPVVNTWDVSVTFGPDPKAVNIDVGIYNPILKEAIDAGFLELPFQFTYNVTIAGP